MMHPVYEISNMPDIQRQKKTLQVKSQAQISFQKRNRKSQKGTRKPGTCCEEHLQQPPTPSKRGCLKAPFTKQFGNEGYMHCIHSLLSQSATPLYNGYHCSRNTLSSCCTTAASTLITCYYILCCFIYFALRFLYIPLVAAYGVHLLSV